MFVLLSLSSSKKYVEAVTVSGPESLLVYTEPKVYRAG